MNSISKNMAWMPLIGKCSSATLRNDKVRSIYTGTRNLWLRRSNRYPVKVTLLDFLRFDVPFFFLLFAKEWFDLTNQTYGSNAFSILQGELHPGIGRNGTLFAEEVTRVLAL